MAAAAMSGLFRRQPAALGALLLLAALHGGTGCGPAHRAPVATPAPPPAPPAPPPRLVHFEATAYSITGTTASGKQTRRGIVAADPKILPIGTRIRVQDAGRYSGAYTVSDTGPAVNGREIDIFIPDAEEAKRFGRRKVRVEVLGKE